MAFAWCSGELLLLYPLLTEQRNVCVYTKKYIQTYLYFLFSNFIEIKLTYNIVCKFKMHNVIILQNDNHSRVS